MSRGLPRNVSNLLDKAKESALLAVDVYNKPKTSFRSGGFIVLMSVAWTSLLHAIFERDGIKYYYKQSNGRYVRVDGDKKAWDLSKSVNEYYESNDPVKVNIDIFIALRNKIEHRFMPSLDLVIAGECQALILNFEELIVQEFGDKHSLIENLFIPLQFTRQKRSIPKTKSEKAVLDFVKKFRSSLDAQVSESQHYAFKAYFIPKLGNHRSSSDVAIEFVNFDSSNPEEMKNYEKLIVGVKEKQVPVANQGKYRPKSVVEELSSRLGRKVSLNQHTNLWKKHGVRPLANGGAPTDCNTEYCQLDAASTQKDYVYTDEWINLCEKELREVADSAD